MRNLTKVLILVAAAALLSTGAWAQIGSGVAGSAHNFAGYSGSGTCTFCHTPHQAGQQSLLWNHTLSTNTFSWTETSTTTGTDYPTFDGDVYVGATAKCLSCHDNSVALGDIGWFDDGPANLLPDTIETYWGDSGRTVGAGGDMDGNHPVAMPYPFNNVASTYNGITTGTATVLTEFVADPQGSGIPLYSSNGAKKGGVNTSTGMECTSCHDVHNGPATQDSYLLRGLLGGSTADYICVKCHIK